MAEAESKGIGADADAISSSHHSETIPPRNAEAVNEKDVGLSPKHPIHNTNRRVSEWEALQIAQAGDLDTINAEVDEIEADLQRMNLRSTWYKPLLNFRDPKLFGYLLVGKIYECSWGTMIYS
jgi:hypothetical protein